VAALTTNVIPVAGLRIDNLFTAAAGGGDDAETGAGVDLIVKTTGTLTTVTIATPETFDGLALADRTFTTAATAESKIPLPSNRYRDPTTGRATITYSSVTGVTVCVTRTLT
jgi:hypothetical protein